MHVCTFKRAQVLGCIHDPELPVQYEACLALKKMLPRSGSGIIIISCTFMTLCIMAWECPGVLGMYEYSECAFNYCLSPVKMLKWQMAPSHYPHPNVISIRRYTYVCLLSLSLSPSVFHASFQHCNCKCSRHVACTYTKQDFVSGVECCSPSTCQCACVTLDEAHRGLPQVHCSHK